jgi:hypothetical protein
MRCIGCGSTAVSKRNERTAQGYRRFRGRGCRKQFNFKWLFVEVRRSDPRRRGAAPAQVRRMMPAGDTAAGVLSKPVVDFCQSMPHERSNDSLRA